MRYLLMLFLATTVHAESVSQPVPAVLNGSPAVVAKTRVAADAASDGKRQEVYATVTYNPICEATPTFIVMQTEPGKYEVIIGKPRPAAGSVSCFAIGIASEEIDLGPVPTAEEGATALTVNGQAVN